MPKVGISSAADRPARSALVYRQKRADKMLHAVAAGLKHAVFLAEEAVSDYLVPHDVRVCARLPNA